MLKARNNYILLGLGLVLTGIWFAPLAHWILKSTPLSALGLSMVILGAICIMLGRTRPSLSPEASMLLLETSLENISSIIEELGLRAKGIYLPSSQTGGRFQALIPLRTGKTLPDMEKTLPKRLIVRYGPGAEDVGLLITTPGSTISSVLETMPGPSPAEIEDAMTSVLSGALDIADGVRFSMNGTKAIVDIFKPRLEHRKIRFYELLGTPAASIAAALTSEALNRPVSVTSETVNKNKTQIELEIL